MSFAITPGCNFPSRRKCIVSGTFTRLEGRLRDLPFPASFRPFAAYETEATALYVFEHYHQTLAASLSDARRQVRQHAC